MNQYDATNRTNYSPRGEPGPEPRPEPGPEPRSAKGRPCAIISLLMAVALLGLFFMPWLTVSCDGQAIMTSAPPGARCKTATLAQQMSVPQSRLTEKRALASATGWALAAGKLTFAEDLTGNPKAVKPAGNDKVPKSRRWVYMGLALPGLLVLICGFAAAGGLPARAGKWMLLLGLTGLTFMIVAARVDYIDDAIDQACSDMPRPANLCKRAANDFRAKAKAQLERAGGRMKKIIKTEATVYLWVSLGLYGVIAGCGFVTVMAGDPGAPYPPPPATRRLAERRRHADQRAGAMPGFGPEIYQPGAGAPSWRGAEPSSTPSPETAGGPPVPSPSPGRPSWPKSAATKP